MALEHFSFPFFSLFPLLSFALLLLLFSSLFNCVFDYVLVLGGFA